MNDDELDALLRSGLATRADDITPSKDFASLAHDGVQRRRHWRAGLSAAAVVAVVVSTAGVVESNRSSESDPPVAVHQTTPSDVPDGWRSETYGTVQLWVPPDWGWGASPVHGPDATLNEASDCGVGIGRAPDTIPLSDLTRVPYVGRPVYLSDACLQPIPDDTTAAYVWFDSPVDIGTDQLNGGYTRETFEIGGQHVSVADTDADELQTIVGSATKVTSVDASGCLSDGKAAYEAVQRSPSISSIGDVRRLSVCVYNSDDPRNSLPSGLVYSNVLDGQDAASAVNAIMDAHEPSSGCALGSVGPQPILVVDGTDGEVSISVSTVSCAAGYESSFGMRDLAPDNVAFWAVGGIPLYVVGVGLPDDVAAYFMHVLG